MAEERQKETVTKKSWDEFRNTGLLWFANSILHMFGWAIVVEMDKGEIIRCYPARVKFRGFSEERNTEVYKQLNTYMYQNSGEPISEAYDDEE